MLPPCSSVQTTALQRTEAFKTQRQDQQQTWLDDGDESSCGEEKCLEVFKQSIIVGNIRLARGLVWDSVTEPNEGLSV